MRASLLRALVAVAGVATLGVGLVAAPQSPVGTPPDVNVGILLDQARAYADQQRYDEAIGLLQRAMTSIRRTQAMAAGTPVGLLDAPVRIGGSVKAPMKIRHMAPVYPADARAAGAQGRVILEATIDETGEVTGIAVLRSLPLLDAAAIDAVSQWRYTPTFIGGVATPVVMTVTVDFALN